MKIIEQIKEEVANEVGSSNWNQRMGRIGTPAEFDYLTKEVAERYAQQYKDLNDEMLILLKEFLSLNGGNIKEVVKHKIKVSKFITKAKEI